MAIINKKRGFHSEIGGSLLAVMALISILAIVLMIVAPEIKQEIQREKEHEAIRRGEEVAEAIRQYYLFYNCSKLPNSMDELLEGLPFGTKKRAILRASSAIDPLSPDGKWRLIQPEPKFIAQFAKRVQKYNDGALPDSPNRQCFDRFAITITTVVDTESEEDNEESAEESDETFGADSDKVPFIGVASKSKSRSVLTYYGIENHSKWVFTPLFRGQGIYQNNTRNSNTSTPIIPNEPEDKPRDD